MANNSLKIAPTLLHAFQLFNSALFVAIRLCVQNDLQKNSQLFVLF